MDVPKTVHLNELFDLYGQLLTERQRLLFERYYQQDLSLSEIADEFGISRQAVHDILRRSERALEQFERKLGLAIRYRRQQALLNDMERGFERWRSEAAQAGAVCRDAADLLASWIEAWRQELEADAGTGEGERTQLKDRRR